MSGGRPSRMTIIEWPTLAVTDDSRDFFFNTPASRQSIVSFECCDNTMCFNSFPLILRVKAACFHLTVQVLLNARILTLICAGPSFKANFSHYNFPNANLSNF